MGLRQEQVVFLAAAGIVGLLVVNRSGGNEVVRGGGARSTALELEHFGPPDVDRALPAEGAIVLTRGVFQPPRDTRPLAPLPLVEPPRRLTVALSPPPEPGTAPRYWADLLHALPEVIEVPELFASDEISDLPAIDAAATFDEPAGAGGGEDELLDVSDRARAMLQALGHAEGSDPAIETAEERVARLEGYKNVYDWIRINSFQHLFGRIENDDRFGLRDLGRESEAVLFVELDPETGAPRMPGQSAIAYERERVTDLGFANTPANRIELERRDLGTLSPAEYRPALELADACVRMRHEAPRALEVARELYATLAQLDEGDPMPRLGLARCLEAGFEFEQAFAEYERLLETWDHRAIVHVRLAELESRFLLFERAEERLRHAVALEPASSEANHALGSYLLDRGRGAEAIGHLARASEHAPREPELRHVRTRIRYDLVRAQLAAGRIAEAKEACTQMRRGDAGSPLTQAAWLSTLLLEPEGAGLDAELGEGVDLATDVTSGVGGGSRDGLLELQVARGLWQLRNRDWSRARDELLAAANLDPLRAGVAWRALSWLAEITGYPDQAMRYAELAVECDPHDAYALYQRGRLAALQDDVEGARESLMAALAVDVELEDALLALAELAYDGGLFEEAERYFERAVQLAPERDDLHARRGVNFLVQGLVEDARASFERSRALDPNHPTPRAGLAWVEYLAGDPEEALIQLANLDESRRDIAPDDPWRLWAAAQIERVRDHLQKVAWSDSFERREIRNRWFVEEKVGPLIEIVEGTARLSGTFAQGGRTRLYREYPAGIFVSFEADLRVQSGGAARVGLFLARERERRGELEVVSEASLSRHKDGALQTRLLRSGDTNREWQDALDFELVPDRWVRVRVERVGEGTDALVTLSLDGIPVLENEPLVGLGQSTSPLHVGVFAEGETGRKVHLEIDDVEVVYRQ